MKNLLQYFVMVSEAFKNGGKEIRTHNNDQRIKSSKQSIFQDPVYLILCFYWVFFVWSNCMLTPHFLIDPRQKHYFYSRISPWFEEKSYLFPLYFLLEFYSKLHYSYHLINFFIILTLYPFYTAYQLNR